jgi:hypothetical protein
VCIIIVFQRLTSDVIGPSQAFELAFVPGYAAAKAAGVSETYAKASGIPGRSFITQMMSLSPAMESHVQQKVSRAHESAEHQAAKTGVRNFTV